MKNKLIIWGVCVSVLFSFTINFTSCKPDYETNFDEKVLKVPARELSPIYFTIDGGQKSVKVETNLPIDGWQVLSNADWCKVTKSDGKVNVSAGKSEMYVVRTARITIKYGHQEYSIPVTQAGYISTLTIHGKTEGWVEQISATGGVLEVKATSNLNIDHVTIPDDAAKWLTFVSATDVPGSNTEKMLKFNVLPSYNTQDRSATVLVQSSQNYAQTATFIITQIKRTPTAINLTTSMLSANATQSGDGGGLPALIDNDKNTYYHTLWSAASPGGKLHYVQFNLTGAIQLLKVEYVSRSSGDGGGDVTRAGIWISTTGGDTDAEWTKAATITFPLPGGRAVRTSSNELVNFGGAYKFIRFVPEARRNADPINPSAKNGWWNMADIYLYTFQ